MAFNPTYRINLVKLFNRAFNKADPALRDSLRATLASPVFKDMFGKTVIDEIVKRTLSGIDKNNKGFAPYSEAYKNSDIFKIYQKTNQVNLELTGEMLSSLISNQVGQDISIELIGDNNKAKAHGHIYGLGKRKVVRDFLGLPDDVLEKLMVSSVERFKNEEFQVLTGSFHRQRAVDVFANVGNQPTINFGADVNLILAGVAANEQ